jgi:hypothetical protein
LFAESGPGVGAPGTGAASNCSWGEGCKRGGEGGDAGEGGNCFLDAS